MKNVIFSRMSLIFLLLLIVIYLVDVNVKQKAVITSLNSTIQNDISQISYFKNKLGQEVASKTAVITSSKEELKTLSDKIFNLNKKDQARIKKINHLTQIVQAALIADTLHIAYDTIITVKPDDFYVGNLVHKDSVIIPPRGFMQTDPYFTIKGTVKLQGIELSKIELHDTLTVRTIIQRPKGIINRLTKSNETVVQAIHSNPHIKTGDLKSFTIKENPSTWHKIVKPALFLGIGILISSK